MTTTYTAADLQDESKQFDHFFKIYWNAPYIVVGFHEEGDGTFTASTCHAEDFEHAQMYQRYLDVRAGTYELHADGKYHRMQ